MISWEYHISHFFWGGFADMSRGVLRAAAGFLTRRFCGSSNPDREGWKNLLAAMGKALETSGGRR
jgi:hypothetical protein